MNYANHFKLKELSLWVDYSYIYSAPTEFAPEFKDFEIIDVEYRDVSILDILEGLGMLDELYEVIKSSHES